MKFFRFIFYLVGFLPILKTKAQAEYTPLANKIVDEALSQISCPLKQMDFSPFLAGNTYYQDTSTVLSLNGSISGLGCLARVGDASLDLDVANTVLTTIFEMTCLRFNPIAQPYYEEGEGFIGVNVNVTFPSVKIKYDVTMDFALGQYKRVGSLVEPIGDFGLSITTAMPSIPFNALKSSLEGGVGNNLLKAQMNAKMQSLIDVMDDAIVEYIGMSKACCTAAVAPMSLLSKRSF